MHATQFIQRSRRLIKFVQIDRHYGGTISNKNGYECRQNNQRHAQMRTRQRQCQKTGTDGGSDYQSRRVDKGFHDTNVENRAL